MCLETAIYFNSLPAETKIIVLQIILIIIEILSFFYIRNITKE